MGRLAIVAVLSALLLLGWWFFGSRRSPSASARTGERARGISEARASVEPLEADAADPAARIAADESSGAVAIEGSAAEPAAQRTGPLLEVLVTYDGAPLAGAEVRIVPFEETSEFLVGGASQEPIARVSTDPSGVARIELEEASALGISADGPSGAIGRTRIVPSADTATSRVVVALGSASLEGVVRGLEGAPAADTRVLACQRGQRGEHGEDGATLWFTARTDASGNYRLAGLEGGAGRIFTATLLDLPLGETLPFALAPGETKRIDFGSSSGRGSWSGTFRTPNGVAIRGPEHLFFVADADSSSTQSYFDDQGRFLARLPAGAHTVHLGTPTGVVLGRADVFGEIALDLVAPRAFLHGRIRYVGAKHPVARGPENDVELRLERADGTSVGGTMRGSSTYGWVGLEPATYTLTARPWVLDGAANGRVRVEIAPGITEIELDLAITDP